MSVPIVSIVEYLGMKTEAWDTVAKFAAKPFAKSVLIAPILFVRFV